MRKIITILFFPKIPLQSNYFMQLFDLNWEMKTRDKIKNEFYLTQTRSEAYLEPCKALTSLAKNPIFDVWQDFWIRLTGYSKWKHLKNVSSLNVQLLSISYITITMKNNLILSTKNLNSKQIYWLSKFYRLQNLVHRVIM